MRGTTAALLVEQGLALCALQAVTSLVSEMVTRTLCALNVLKTRLLLTPGLRHSLHVRAV